MDIRYTITVCSLLIALAAGSATASGARTRGPWSVNSDAPVLLTRQDRERAPRPPAKPASASVAATPFHWSLRIYQKYVSPLDGERCPMYPTCSQYGVQAIRKHGPVIGIIMTADRLLHEANEQLIGPKRTVGNRVRTPDPVENNDFWWMSK